jgi:small GTP-binding protein
MVEQESNEDSVDNSVSVTRYKIIFVCDAAVGKTSIIQRIIDNPFSETYENSIGVDFCSKNIKYKGQSSKLQIWDTAGQEKYKSLIPSYVRNASSIFIVYDVASKTSFDNVSKWISFIKTIENCNMILCANKIDLESERQVTTEEGKDFAKKNELTYYEVSAKNNTNVKRMFYSVVADLSIFAEETDKEGLIKQLEE